MTGDRASRWRETLVGWRNRLLGSAKFRRFAERFPVLRRIARREAAAMFDLCAGFVYSQILFACVRLGVFEFLADGPRAARDLAHQARLPRESALRLLEAASALDLVESLGGERYALGPRGVIVLANPGIAAMIEHHALLYQDLADPVALLRDPDVPTRIGRYWAYARNPQARDLAPHEVADYSALMALSQPLIAEQVLAAYPVERHRCVLDVGGGEGAFLLAVARHTSTPRLMLFDLPGVAERARQRVKDAGLAARVHVVDGDFFKDALPIGADLVTLVRVIHDHDDAQALELLRAVRRCLPDHGTVLLAEPMAGAPDAERVGAAYFGFYLMAMRSGLPRTPETLCALLLAAGFEKPRLLAPPMPLQTLLVIAESRK